MGWWDVLAPYRQFGRRMGNRKPRLSQVPGCAGIWDLPRGSCELSLCSPAGLPLVSGLGAGLSLQGPPHTACAPWVLRHQVPCVHACVDSSSSRLLRLLLWWFVVWLSWWTLTLFPGASSMGTTGPASCAGVPVAPRPPQPGWSSCWWVWSGFKCSAVALSAFSSQLVSPADACPGLSPLNGVPSSPALQCPGCVCGWLCALQACSPFSGV